MFAVHITYSIFMDHPPYDTVESGTIQATLEDASEIPEVADEVKKRIWTALEKERR